MGDVEDKAPLPGKRVTSATNAVRREQSRSSQMRKAVNRAQRQRNKTARAAQRTQAIREAQRKRG